MNPALADLEHDPRPLSADEATRLTASSATRSAAANASAADGVDP